jgi:hypothetical protein
METPLNINGMNSFYSLPSVEGLESRQMYAVSFVEIAPGPTTTVTTQTLLVMSDAVGDTISVSSTINPPGSAFRYNYKGTSLPALGINANDLRVFGGGGNDDITIQTCFIGWVSGSTGDDKITLIECNRMMVSALQPSDTDEGQARPVDGADTIDLQDTTFTSADGGDSVDTFTTSGNCNGSTLIGGSGADSFAPGGTFSNAFIYGGPDNDIVTGSGNWSSTIVHGDDGNDRVDCRACTGLITLFGDNGDDTMWAGSSGNKIYGGDGRDRMIGGVGDDWFYAVDGNWDVISGGTQVNGDHAEVDYPNPDGTDLDWLSDVEFVTYKFPA